MGIMSKDTSKEVGFSFQQCFHCSMSDDPQISLHYNLKHYDLKLELIDSSNIWIGKKTHAHEV